MQNCFEESISVVRRQLGIYLRTDKTVGRMTAPDPKNGHVSLMGIDHEKSGRRLLGLAISPYAASDFLRPNISPEAGRPTDRDRLD